MIGTFYHPEIIELSKSLGFTYKSYGQKYIAVSNDNVYSFNSKSLISLMPIDSFKKKIHKLYIERLKNIHLEFSLC